MGEQQCAHIKRGLLIETEVRPRTAPLTRSDARFVPQRATHTAVTGMRSVPSIKDVYLGAFALRGTARRSARAAACTHNTSVFLGLMLRCQRANITRRQTLNADSFVCPTCELGYSCPVNVSLSKFPAKGRSPARHETLTPQQTQTRTWTIFSLVSLFDIFLKMKINDPH